MNRLKRLSISLCKIQNHDLLNCYGFEITLRVLKNRLKLSIHTVSKTFSLDSKALYLYYSFPKYLRIRKEKDREKRLKQIHLDRLKFLGELKE